MDLGSKLGLMVPNTKVNGKRTKQTAKENSGMLTATFTRASGSKTKPTGMAFTSISTVPGMRGNGAMIYRMAWGKKVGKMDQVMPVDT